MRSPLVLLSAPVLVAGIALGGVSYAKNKKAEQENPSKDTKGEAAAPDAPSDSPSPDASEAKAEARASSADGRRYFVSPSGDDGDDGLSPERPWRSIQKAVDAARPGDTVRLADGAYLQDIVSRRDGTPEKPIVLSGSSGAVVKGGGNARVIEINHDYLALEGFTVDGHYKDADDARAYRDKLLYVLGKGERDGVTGLRVSHMRFLNAGGECIRFRYFARKNEVAHNTIERCGVADFRFKGGGKNGEGVYIGTAPEQLKDGKNPTKDPDRSDGNWIHHNVIDTQGNECVDIKEAATGNVVEYNECTGQKDKESAGLDARGSGNVFRYNTVSGSVGAGVRLGGDGKDDGTANEVYGNRLVGNRSGGVKFQADSQARICGNTLEGNGAGDAVGKYASKFEPGAACR
jgi:hypothetical protein